MISLPRVLPGTHTQRTKPRATPSECRTPLCQAQPKEPGAVPRSRSQPTREAGHRRAPPQRPTASTTTPRRPTASTTPRRPTASTKRYVVVHLLRIAGLAWCSPLAFWGWCSPFSWGWCSPLAWVVLADGLLLGWAGSCSWVLLLAPGCSLGKGGLTLAWRGLAWFVGCAHTGRTQEMKSLGWGRGRGRGWAEGSWWLGVRGEWPGGAEVAGWARSRRGARGREAGDSFGSCERGFWGCSGNRLQVRGCGRRAAGWMELRHNCD